MGVLCIHVQHPVRVHTLCHAKGVLLLHPVTEINNDAKSIISTHLRAFKPRNTHIGITIQISSSAQSVK